MLTKFSLKSLGSTFSSLGLFTFSLSLALPVKAALPCQYGTVNSHPNGSVESCTIENNVDIRIGSFVFPCKQGHFISFDEKAQFQSCVISTPVKIITDQVVETCPEEYRVDVSIPTNGNPSVSCYRSY